jgi:hypothetical protein
MMDIIDHGDWVSYVPEGHPLLEHKVVFCKRVSDGVDWYAYQRSTDLLTSDTVKITLLVINGDLTVMATHRDGSLIFPEKCKLIEVDFKGDHETLRRKRFNPESRSFFDAAPEPVMRTDLLIEMYHAGLLDKWEEALRDHDVPLRLSLSAERPFTEDDRIIKRAAERLGWSREQLRKLFDDARKRIGSQHG